MQIDKAVARLEQQVVEAVNQSGLPPVVVRLVLLNILHAVENNQRELEQEGDKADG